MAVAELLAVEQQIAKQGTDSDYTPKARSLAGTMRAFYDSLDEPHEHPKAGQDLFSRLAAAVTDSYERERSKKARYRPKVSDKKKKKIKPPQVRKMTTDEREKLEQIDGKIAA